jgi:hypothetical protein
MNREICSLHVLYRREEAVICDSISKSLLELIYQVAYSMFYKYCLSHIPERPVSQNEGKIYAQNALKRVQEDVLSQEGAAWNWYIT